MAVHTAKAQMGRPKPEILEQHLAPEIGSFTAAEIPDLQEEFPQANHWVANHFLNTVLRGRFPEPLKPFALNYILRTRLSFMSYHRARELTHTYLNEMGTDNAAIGRYLEAIAAWESFLLNWWIGFQFAKRINDDRNLFEPGDGSTFQRTYDLGNAVKHWPTRKQVTPDDTIPVWLTNAGLASKKDQVTFRELGGVLRDASQLAAHLTDPRRLAEMARKRESEEKSMDDDA